MEGCRQTIIKTTSSWHFESTCNKSVIMRCIFVLFIFLFKTSHGDLVVQIKNGKVKGTTIDTPSGQTFYAWRGIPYAKPPVGNLRYLPPQEAEPWPNVLDASRDSPACVFFGGIGRALVPAYGNSEDCLYINVYSPVPVGSNSSVDRVLPVMFWIYGGGFFTGSGEFAFTDPTPFLEENVIVVTFNYRLGTFGFLSTEDDVLLGNAGLKDHLLALQWTRENIACFGGNPSDVTIFGESAGSGAVGFLIVSPMSRNLFKAAIMESGAPLYNGFQSNPREFAYTLANQIDSSVTQANTSAEILHILQKADPNVIVNMTSGRGIGPSVEIQSEQSFLSVPVYESIESGNISRVPLIIGYNSEESIVFVTDVESARIQANEYDSDPERLVPKMPLKENDTTVRKTIGEKIKQHYVGKNGSFANNLAAYFNWLSDDNFLRSIHKHAILQSKYSPVYMYQFSYYGTLSKDNVVVPGAGKVGHTDEIGYLFNVSTSRIKTDGDYLTRKRLVKLWTNFAKTSNPTPDDDSAELLQNVKWAPITRDNVHYLDIDEDLQMKPNRKLNETIFWDNIWSTYSYRPYNTF